MTDRERIISIARRRRAEPMEIHFVLGVARRTEDRHLLAVCLDCFRSVLRGAHDELSSEVVRFLGELLRGHNYRRIRRRALITAIHICVASGTILPDIMTVYRRPGSRCAWKAARGAALGISWLILADGEAAQRAVALNAYEQFNSLGLLNLRAFLDSDACGADARREVEDTIARLAAQYPDA